MWISAAHLAPRLCAASSLWSHKVRSYRFSPLNQTSRLGAFKRRAVQSDEFLHHRIFDSGVRVASLERLSGISVWLMSTQIPPNSFWKICTRVRLDYCVFVFTWRHRALKWKTIGRKSKCHAV